MAPFGSSKRKSYALGQYTYSSKFEACVSYTSLSSFILFILLYRYLRSEIDSRNADKSVTTSNIRKLLPDVLPNDLPSYIKHKIVKKRIHFLRTEFEWLLDDIRRSSNNDTKVIPMINF